MLIQTARFELEVHRWMLFVRLGGRAWYIGRDQYGWEFHADKPGATL